MTRAEATAWNVYAARLTAIVKKQHDDFAAGRWPCSITIAPPTEEHVTIIQTALDHEAREARNKALDAAIDNSHSKSETVKQCRAGIQAAYDALHALKRDGEPQSADAVDPHADSTGTPSTREKRI
jgi:hypothetical protein